MLRSLLTRLPAGGPWCGIQTNFYRQCSDEVRSRISNLIKKDKVVIFMKGTPEEPRCGYSNRVCSIMTYHGVKFQFYDVLQDHELRQGVKDFTKWPTIPQVFLDGVFVGGYDILLSKHISGEIVQEFEKIGIKSIRQTTKEKESEETKTIKRRKKSQVPTMTDDSE